MLNAWNQCSMLGINAQCLESMLNATAVVLFERTTWCTVAKMQPGDCMPTYLEAPEDSQHVYNFDTIL